MGFVKVAAVAEIASGAGKVVQAGGKAVAVFNAGGTFYALDEAVALKVPVPPVGAMHRRPLRLRSARQPEPRTEAPVRKV